MPPGGNDEARRFYGEVLGLTEVKPPKTLRGDRLVWFLVGEQGDELHLLTEDNFSPNLNGQHLCFVVDDLEDVRARLIADGVTIGTEPEIMFRPRLSFRDPFGNKIELTEIHGDYRTIEEDES